jgi:hypothetical protein
VPINNTQVLILYKRYFYIKEKLFKADIYNLTTKRIERSVKIPFRLDFYKGLNIKNNKVFIYGNTYNQEGNNLPAYFLVYDGNTNKFIIPNNHIDKLNNIETLLLKDGRVFIKGNIFKLQHLDKFRASETYVKDVFAIYDPKKNTFSVIKDSIDPLFKTESIKMLNNDQVYLSGRNHEPYPPLTGWIFNSETNKFVKISDELYKELENHYSYGLLYLPNGKLLKFGEYDFPMNMTRIYSREIKMYDFKTDTWTSIGNMSSDVVRDNDIMLLPDGKILMKGSHYIGWALENSTETFEMLDTKKFIK